MNSPIYPMTFIPKKRNFKLYYLAFPKPWKELLIQLQVSANKKYDPEFSSANGELYYRILLCIILSA